MPVVFQKEKEKENLLTPKKATWFYIYIFFFLMVKSFWLLGLETSPTRDVTKGTRTPFLRFGSFLDRVFRSFRVLCQRLSDGNFGKTGNVCAPLKSEPNAVPVRPVATSEIQLLSSSTRARWAVTKKCLMR